MILDILLNLFKEIQHVWIISNPNMPYQRRRRFYRKKRIFKRKYYRRPTLRIKKGRVIHYFKRMKKDSFTITNAGFVAIQSDTSDAVYNDFRLAQLPNTSDFTNLYDNFKICGIKRKYIFNRNSADVNASQEIPRLLTVNDFNDTGALASESEAMEYPLFKQSRLDRPTSRYWRPTQTTQGGANMVVKSRWNETTNSDGAYHHGLKEAIITTDTATGTTFGTLDVYTTFYLAMRSPK